MKCPWCQQENPSHAKFCLGCGAPFYAAAGGSYEELPAENERLRQSLGEALQREAEALEQQTATSEILRAISGSPTDLRSVLDAVTERAARLCQASDSGIFRLDGDALLLVAHHASLPAGPIGQFTVPVVRGTVTGRAVLERRTIHVGDLQRAPTP
jgi:two-component system, NtrC family, sensor kinase